MLKFVPLLALAAITVATIGEGRTSSKPGSKIQAGQRWFTIYTHEDACESTAAPSSLIAEPIVLWIGDTFALNDPVVAAYDASGTFIPDVPIEILDPDTATRLLKKELHTLHQDYVAVEAGEKVIEIRSTCEGPPWVSANLVITIRETVE